MMHLSHSSLVDGHRRLQENPGFWPAIILGLIVLVPYINSFDGVFLFDGPRSILNNPRLQDVTDIGRVLSGRRPIVDLTFAVNYAVGGNDPTGYHAVNLIIHFVAGLALMGIVRRTLTLPARAPRWDSSATAVALLAAAAWCVHPLQTQSVTYVVQRYESLMGMFYFLTLYCVLRGATQPPGYFWYVLAILCSALGMGSKAVTVTIPVIVALFDWTFLARSWRHLLAKRWWVYAGLVATWGVLFATKFVRQTFFPHAHTVGTVGPSFGGATPMEYLLTQPGVLLRYLRLAVWPYPQSLDYEWPIADAAGSIAPHLIFFLLVLAVAVWMLVRYRVLAFLVAWFFVVLAPTSSIVQMKDPLFEHRMYLSSAAVVVFIVIGAYRTIQLLLSRLAVSDARARFAVRGLAGLCVAALALTTAMRNRVYASETSMWENVVTTRPENTRGHYNLGRAWLDEGNASAAEQALRRALDVDPLFVEAHYNLGKALATLGRTDGARRCYEDALRLDPKMGQARSDLGNILVREGRLEEGVAHYREAIRTTPEYVRTYVNLGTVLLMRDEVEEAVGVLRQAVKIEPDTARIRFSLAEALERQGRVDEAAEQRRKGERLTVDR